MSEEQQVAVEIEPRVEPPFDAPAQPETYGVVKVAAEVLHQLLLLPKHIEVVGASNDLMQYGAISLLLRCKGALPVNRALLRPYYMYDETKDGRRCTCVDHIEWVRMESREYAGLVILPDWLLAPDDQVMPQNLKALYRALLYQSYKDGNDCLFATTRQMLRLAELMSIEGLKSQLGRLQERGFLTWRSEGAGKMRKWYITLTATAGERRAALE